MSLSAAIERATDMDTDGVAQRLVALPPGNLDELLLLADLVYDITDSPQAAQAILANLTPAQREDPDVIYRRKVWARDAGDLAEFKRLDEKQPYEQDGSPLVGAVLAGLVYWGAGPQTSDQQSRQLLGMG